MDARGRPSDYTDELAEEICIKIATQSKGILRLCEENEHWPDRSTIFRWKLDNQHFCDLYDKAKQAQLEVLHDDLITISDDTSKDLTENDSGKIVYNNECVNRSRLKIDTRKWILERLAPKKFGAKQETSRSDEDVSLMQKLIDKL
jgi:hypothetical protein